jgi:hypothetical protein
MNIRHLAQELAAGVGFLALIVLLVFVVAATAPANAQSFDPPEFRVIPAPQDVGRIGVIRISCFDEGGSETLRYMQEDPAYTTLPDGRQAHIPPSNWTTWVDGVYSCAASVGKTVDDTPIPSAPVQVEVDIPLSPPTLEVGAVTAPGEHVAALCVSPDAMVGVTPDQFAFDGLTCWDRSTPTGPYTEAPISVRIPVADLVAQGVVLVSWSRADGERARAARGRPDRRLCRLRCA